MRKIAITTIAFFSLGLVAFIVFTRPAYAATFTVTETGDQVDASPGDGLCDYDAGTIGAQCTLRAAIEEANALAGADAIEFNIPTTDPGYRDYDSPNTASSGDSSGGDDYWTIRPATDLPSISDTLTIDGASQTTNSGDTNSQGPEIEIRPVTIMTLSYGLSFAVGSDGSIVDGLALFGFGALVNSNTIPVASSSFTLRNSHIGLDARGLGSTALTPYGGGVRFASAAGSNLVEETYFAGLADGVLVATCIPGAQVRIRASHFGINRNNAAATANARGIVVLPSDDCHLIVGGDNVSDRNIISNSTSQGILHGFTHVSGEPNTRFEIYNNFFGTDETGLNPIPNSDVDIRFQGNNYDGVDNQITIGGVGKGNLFRFSNRAIWINNPARDTLIEYNSFGDHANRSILVDTPNLASQGQIVIRQNYIGEAVADPYFGVPLGGNAQRGIQMRSGVTDLRIESNEIRSCGTNGIEINSGGSHTIIGNIIEGCGIFGIYSTGENLNVRNDTATDRFSDPQIGGVAALAGSRCGGTERNCISGNAQAGIYSMDTVPANESTLYSDNDFGTGNGPAGEINIEQAWYGLFELFSGSRRTDLADESISLSASELGVFIRDFNFLPVSTISNRTLQCVADPLTSTYCTGSNAAAGVANRTGYSAFFAPLGTNLTDVTSWYRVAEYTVDGDGNKLDYSSSVTPSQFREIYFNSRAFSFDGNGTSNTSSSDRGERWTSSPTATRNINTGEFSRFQIMEVEYVDANPIWDGSKWVITVDSTSDENNVSTCGFDDGDGPYSGGGCGGSSGLPNGRTSLREAIIVANNFAQPVTIEFNIPTTDPGYDTSGYPNQFTIEPITAFPSISDDLIVDGGSQESFTGDLNLRQDHVTAGPEIVLNLENVVASTHFISVSSSIDLNLNKLGFHNYPLSVVGNRRVFSIGSINSFNINNCDFIGNQKGAIQISGTVNSISMIGSVWKANAATLPGIDNIELRSGINILSTLTVRNNEFIDNGGAALTILADGLAAPDIVIRDNDFIGNGGGDPGLVLKPALGLHTLSSGADITGNRFENNYESAIDIFSTSSGVKIYNNIFTNSESIDLNFSGSAWTGDGPTANDVGDIDSGANELQNYPEINKVEYLGVGKYKLSGTLDGNASEGPWDIEVCESDKHVSGHGGCIQTLGHVQTSENSWSAEVAINGSNGLDDRSFTALATNVLGSTSEFSSNFNASLSNPNYSFAQYGLQLIYPVNNVEVKVKRPQLIWKKLAISEVDHYDVYLDGGYITTVSGNINTLTLDYDLSLGAHTWQVVAYNSVNIEIARSDVGHFRVIEPTIIDIIIPPVPPLINPGDGSVSVSDPTPLAPDVQGDLNLILIATVLLANFGFVLIYLGSNVHIQELGKSGWSIIGILVGVIFRNQNKYWGVVFDEETSKGIAYAVVKLTHLHTKQSRSITTDVLGRYAFKFESGEYMLEVFAKGFAQHKETLKIDVSADVMLDVRMRRVKGKLSIWQKLNLNTEQIMTTYRRLVLVIMLTCFTYSVYAFAVQPSLINTLILLVYGLIFAINAYYWWIKRSKLIGKVVDANSQRGLERASIRLKNKANIFVAITDKQGYFNLNIEPGIYNIYVYRDGYMPQQTENFEVKNGFNASHFSLTSTEK